MESNGCKRVYLDDKKVFIAHLREDGTIQCLEEHLEETAFLAGKFATKIGLEMHGKLLGLTHDFGKLSSQYDRYIRSATGLIDQGAEEYIDAKRQKGKIDHSTAGGQLIYRYFLKKGNDSLLLSQILSLIIASHHSGLIDCITPDGKDNFSKRMNKPEEETYIEECKFNLNSDIKQKIEELLADDILINQFQQTLVSLWDKNDCIDLRTYQVGLLVKFLFSCLIDADRLSTANFENPHGARLRNQGVYLSWKVMIGRLNSYLNQFETRNRIDALRQKISDGCYKFSGKPKGLYQLTVPTGGGKTLASLRFALNHADKYNMDRIIYVIPYTSIIDQNADIAREALEDEKDQEPHLNRIVLEHHSNLTPEEESIRHKLLCEDWDAPVIFTTMVQFLETLFGSGTRSIRRMHQLANAVIIFDEIQTLPVRCVHLFNMAISFLIRSCGSTVVLCTATQPLLDKVTPSQRALQITQEQQMVSDTKRLFEELKRVEVYDSRKNEGWTTLEVTELAKQELYETGSVLIVVNTKKAAKELFQQLKEHPEAEVYHLSTNMCPAHRMSILKDIEACLPETRPIICISTQLIEAGINLDFGTVIRYSAGLDSIAQAAGRCNRNNRRPKKGRVFIVNPAEENLGKLKDIKIGRDAAERVLDEFKNDPEQFDGDIIGLKAMERYYQYYFYARADEMAYKVGTDSEVGRDDTLYELLSTNCLSLKSYIRKNSNPPIAALHQSFMTAAKAFQAIDSPTQGIIVPYEQEGKRIINELHATKDLEEQSRLLKEAQRYSVNVFPHVMQKLAEQKAIREIAKGMRVMYLDAQYYSDEFGLSEIAVNDMELLYCEAK